MIRSSIIVILIVILINWYCFGVRAMASDGLPDGEQAGPSCAPLGPLPGTFLGPAWDILSDSGTCIGHSVGEFVRVSARHSRYH